MRGIIPGVVLSLLCVFYTSAMAAGVVHPEAMTICSIIINEMTEGKISSDRAKEISLAIARAGNKNFGRVTCGDMWLYMAIAHVESGFRNNIINSENCRGMFQVHAPSWARKFGLRYVDLLDLQTNADCGIRVFKYYLQQYKNLVPTLSAYNSDHPWAATGYARAVLGTRRKIQKRYVELYREFREEKKLASNPSPAQMSKPDAPVTPSLP
jgi:hypothetical protein